MTIAPLFNIDREKMGAMRILKVINDSVYLCICRFLSDVFKIYTSHSFFYDSYFTQLEKSECCGAIIDNISYASIFVLEVKDITRKTTLNNVLRKFFEVSCIVDFAFKVTKNDIS